MKFFDCNLHLAEFNSPISVIKEYFHFNIKDIIVLCDNSNSFYFLKKLLKDFSTIKIGIGLHPNLQYSLSEKQEILKILKNEVRILGECGLDLLRRRNTIETQKKNLFSQLNIAEKKEKIIILHIINAEEIIIDILHSFNLKNVILHWFSGNIKYVNKLVDCGLYFSFNNCILQSTKYKDIIYAIPTENLLLESDAPQKYKGIITHPEDFPKIVREIAKIKNLSKEVVSKILYENFTKIFIKNINFDRKKKKYFQTLINKFLY